MEACMFCHSTDRHIVEGTFLSSFHVPSILGHEGVGTIVELGPKVKHRQIGDRVLRPQAIYPGDVQDGIGSGWGGFAEFGKVRDGQAMVDDGLLAADAIPLGTQYQAVVPPDISFDQSVLMITQKEIFSASNKVEEVAGQRLAVAGAGITGCLFGLFLRWRGAEVTMLARREGPLTFALEHGCADDVKLIAEATQLPADYAGLVDTTGSLAATDWLADRLLRPDGVIYSYAVYEGMTQEGFFDELKGKHPFTRVDPAEATAHEAALAMLRDGRFDPAPFVTGRFGMDDWEAAWRSVNDGSSLKTGIFFV
jgi:(R,R)-butanediol dehydrogenase/meso-butanediol dehydrogenase/diacetyl reductase